MDWKKIIVCSLCGGAFCAHVWHESHQAADDVGRPLAAKPMIDTKLYVRLPHGNEPEAPGGPLRTPSSIMNSTSTVSSTASFQIVGFPGGIPRSS